LKQPGSRHLEVQVNRETDEFILMENIIEKASFDKSKINVSLTLDCISNIFIDRKLVIPKMLYLQGEIIKNGIKYGYDHKIPYCYIYKSGLKMRKNSCSCFINTSGLIDADLNLRFCNQHQKKLIQIMQEGRFLPWRILENYLIHNYYKLQMTALDKICLECVFFDNVCNGGCWITKEIISREDVINYSDFPKI
jgi:radical SAM protein with 4Fe4S-binding SPASM domain